jgi:hypothetical protein
MKSEVKEVTTPLGKWERCGPILVCPVDSTTAGITFKWKQASRRVQIRAKRREGRTMDSRGNVDNNTSTGLEQSGSSGAS